MSAASYLPPDCPDCGSVATQTEADGFAVCHSCGRRWALAGGALVHEFEGTSPITVTAIAAGGVSPAFVRCSTMLPDSGRVVEIEITGPRGRFGDASGVPAQVNWAGIGSVGAGDAATYASLLRFAAVIAVDLD